MHACTVPESSPIVAPPAAFRQPNTSTFYRTSTRNAYLTTLVKACNYSDPGCSDPGYAVQWPYMQVGFDTSPQVRAVVAAYPLSVRVIHADTHPRGHLATLCIHRKQHVGLDVGAHPAPDAVPYHRIRLFSVPYT